MTSDRALQDILHQELANALHVSPEELDLEQSFLAQGGDSLMLVHLMSKCRMHGIEIDIVDTIQNSTLSEFINNITSKSESKPTKTVPYGYIGHSDTTTTISTSNSDNASTSSSDSYMLLDASLKDLSEDSVGRIESIGPCSSMQSRILISQAVNPAVYQCRFVLKVKSRVPGSLTASKIRNIWRQVVARHSSLRTTFRESEKQQSMFTQIVWTEVEPNVTILQDEGQIDLDGTVQHFDRAAVPHHLYICQQSPSEVILSLEISHAVVDGQSAGVLLQDVYAAYENQLPAAKAISYGDFVHLEKQSWEGTTEFWREYLQGAEETFLGGVGNKPRVGLHTLQEHVCVPVKQARQFCDTHGVTLVSVCQLAWGMVLRFFAMKEDVTFSYVNSGRQTELSGMHAAVGLFISSLLMRLDFTENPKVSDMLKTVTENIFRSMAYDKVPLTAKGSKLPTSQKWGNSILSFGTDWQPSLASFSKDLEMCVVRRVSPTDYDHSINVEIGDEVISVDYDIWTSITDKADAVKMLNCFVGAIQFILANPEAKVGDFDGIGAKDAVRLRRENGNGRQAVDSCIHSLVQDVTDREPDEMAVYAWDGTMTYRELDTASSSFAEYLMSLGVGPEVMVGICMDKSRWVTVSMLAVLKAGGVVLPLGTTQPLSRLQTIMADTRAPIVLVDQMQLGRLADLDTRQLIAVNAQFLDGLALVSRSACFAVKSSNAAWVVYTSGSTGTPKGVVLQHSSLCTSIQSHGTAFGVGKGSRVLQFASHTFDVTIQEIFTTLCLGGCTCIPSEYERINHLQDFIAKAQVNFLSLTSTVAGLLDPSQLPLVKTMILMGEPVKPAVLDLWKDQASVLESYAPSECSIYATVSPRPMKHISQVSVLGIPLASSFWVVNPKDYNQLCPIGAPGELLIEGPLLARGYLNDSFKTQKSFITDPGFVSRYSLGQNRRMYRTGDLVRQNADGSFTTLGRRDTQIKIRGQRVEVDEIEYHITRHPSNVQAVLIFVHEQLVAAFSLPKDGEAASSGATLNGNIIVDTPAALLVASEIQLYLSQYVPDYMIPRLWIPMASLPINSSGKADRRSIAECVKNLTPDELASYSKLEHQAEETLQPTPIERQLQEIWGTVLNISVSHISYRRSFLSLGGDSITAMQVVSACRRVGLIVTVRDILQSPAISEVALRVKESADRMHEPPIEIPDEPFDLSPAQRMFFNDIAASGLRADGPYRFNQSVCFRLQHPVQQSTMARTIEAIVAKHAMLRARFQTSIDQGWQQRIEKQIMGSYHFQTHQASDDQATQDIMQHSQGLLDLEYGPVFAADLIEMLDRQVLTLTAHHLVIDLMSWRIIATDIQHLLQSQTMLRSHSLPFYSWSNALIQRARTSGARTSEAVAPAPETASPWSYWGLDPGRYVAEDQIFATLDLDEETTSMLLGPANEPLQSGAVDILLAALYLSFQGVFNDRTVPPVYIENHGREGETSDWDLSDTVGWFTTMTPFSLPETNDNPGFISALQQIKDFRILNASRSMLDFAIKYANENLSQNPIELLFNYHGQFQQLGRSDGLLTFDKLHQGALQSNTSIGGKVKQQAALAIEVSVDAGRAHISIGFSRNCTKGDNIRQWLRRYGETIAEGVHELITTDRTATMSDFPLSHLCNADLVALKQHLLDPAGISWEVVEDVLPCSPIQQGILLSQLKSPTTYRLKQTCRILPTESQVVDINRLAEAWREVVRQHSIMRTIFTSTPFGQRFYQVVLKTLEPNICVVNYPIEADIQECIDREASLEDRPGRPSHRFLIITTEDGRHTYGHFEISHALVDASSVQLLVHTLLQAYDGTTAICGSNYGSYISFLEHRSEEEDLHYWEGQLATAEPCQLQLGEDLNGVYEIDIDHSVTTTMYDISTLQNLCRIYSITPANVLQLAWALVLSSRTEQDQICFGYLTSGRDIDINGVETLVGPMINMIICDVRLDYRQSSIDSIRSIQDLFLDNFEHQRASLASIQHSLQGSQQSLFNTTVSYVREPDLSSRHSKSLQLERIAADESTEYDFNLAMLETERGIDITLQYLPGVATNRTAKRLINHLKNVVQVLSENATTRLGDLDLVPMDDKQAIMTLNREVPAPLDSCIHTLVQETSDRQQDAVAVHAWDGVMTYRELDLLASTLAEHLMKEREIGPEIMVGVCMDKSRWAAVSMLAVLKAGGVVLPLGVQQPLSRLQTILADTGAPVVLVDATQNIRLADINPELIEVNEQLMDRLTPSRRSGSTLVRPNNAAWVVYTSGSTGVPKGVVLQHSALCTSMKSHGAAFGLDAITGVRVLQFAAHTFDVTIQETFTTLYYGGCVCIPSEEERMNDLERCIIAMNVNFLSLTATVAALLDPLKMLLVKTLILIGEPVKPAVLDLWMPQAACLDAYGPSECSIQSAISPKPMTDRRQAMILGTPLKTCRFWVVDPKDYNRLCPIGVLGELLIEGPHLAREYLNDMTKTENSFIIDPGFVAQYGLGSGRRMYRTGDLVRQNDDGTYTNFGRRDKQIKIRGKRVEVGEIEYHITRHHSSIQAIVVFIRHESDASNDGRLVTAFSLPNKGESAYGEAAYSGALNDNQTIERSDAMLLASEIQLYLSQYIPDYMIPRLWIPMATLPINSSGKADRQAITEWINSLTSEQLASYSDLEYQAEEALPVTPIERQLRKVWSNVLNVSNISYRRSFLSLGGDSITAMQVVSACRGLGLTVTVRDILQSPAISDLASRVKATDNVGGQIYGEMPEEPFDLSPAQHMFFHEIAPAGLRSDGPNRFNQSVCFRLQQSVQQQKTMPHAIEAIVTKHAMLRARFQMTRDGWQQRIEKQVRGSYRFQMHRVSHDDKAAQEIMYQSQSSLNLEHGPVFAADLIETPDRQLLFLTAHHLVIDLMSWRIIAKDLEQLLRNGSMLVLHSLPFPTWCSTILERAHSLQKTMPPTAETLMTSWAYWGLKPGQYFTRDQAFSTIDLDEHTTALLLGPANKPLRSGAADILLAALYSSFRQVFSDRTGPSIFIEGHGRDDETMDWDLSDTVGWFTTVTPLYLEENDDNSFISTLRQVKDLRKLNSGRGSLDFAVQRSVEPVPAEKGLIEVLFNYHGQFQQLERVDGLLALDRLHQLIGEPDAAVGGNVRQHAVLSVEVLIDASKKGHVMVGYSRNCQKVETIREWLKEYGKTIVEGTQQLVVTEPTATISDFSLANLNNTDLITLKQHFLTPAGISWDDIDDVLPCSPVQQGILLSQLKAPATYRLRQTCRLLPTQGLETVDVGRLADAWREVTHQHSIMRTIFTGALSHHNRFYQVVLKSPEADIQVINCNTDDEVQRFIQHHALIHDLVGRPSHRFLIITVGEEGHVYGHFEINHALVDASSVQLLVNALLQAYEGSPRGICGSKYSSYVAFMEQRSEEEDLQYWANLLAKAEPCHLHMGQSITDAVPETKSGRVVSATIQDTGALQDLCRTYSVTAANVMQLAWALVLSSRVELGQISFGYLSSGRDVPINGVDTLVGPMINMMICYIQLDYDMTTVDMIRSIQDRFLQDFERQRASLASIQHSLHGTKQQPLFNTTVSYARALNMGGTAGKAKSITLERISADESTEYDFNLNILESEHSIDLVLQYLPGLASGEAAQRLLNQLKHIIQVLSTHAYARIGELGLVSVEDTQAIVAKNKKVPQPVNSCIHALVQEVCVQQPDEMAIYAWDGIMSYHELDVAASTLAEYLMAFGIGPEIMVGICMDKSYWVAVAMLAVLKAGGVVLPLGTQQPLSRVQTIITDTRAPILLVDEAQLGRLSHTGPQLIQVDRQLVASLKPATRSACPTVNPSNAAWVVYTSGSTGTPKGVVLQHSALCSSIRSHGTAFDVRRDSRVLQFASHTFDVTIQEIFTTLCQGGCTCIPSEDERINRLQSFISKAEINFLSLTSTVAGLLEPTKLPLIKTVILMGEPVKPAVMDLWKDQAIVLESYAPSECSIYATVSPRPMKHISQVPVLGKPLASRFWVVDPKNYNCLCPIGAPGELLIEGPLLARGYLNDDIKTQKSFLVDPGFVTAHHVLGKGRRMYRTGDLVRQNDDGSYSTLGRRDTQIKIRGQRVEISEIEYWVARLLPDKITSAAAMLVRRDSSQSAVLSVAVEIPGERGDVSNDHQQLPEEVGLLEPSMALLEAFEQVRSHLIGILPRYMVPDLFIPMARLPVNSSGKLDRRAIDLLLRTMTEEELERYRPTSAVKAYVSTDTERQLQLLWGDVLGRPANTVGAKDNFFHLGGDSVTAMRLVEASQSTNMLLRVADVFEHPSLSDLAGVMDCRRVDEQDRLPPETIPAFSLWPEHTQAGADGKVELLTEVAERCGVMVEQIEDVYPCTPLQEGLLVNTIRQPTSYISRRVFTLGDEIDVVRLQAAWQKMAEAAFILRTRILLGHGSTSVQVVVNTPLEWHKGTSLEDYFDHDRALVMAEGRPLVRFGLLELDGGEQLFVWTAHHSIYDGWSMMLMYRRVADIYWQEAAPRSAPYTPFIAYLAQADPEKSAGYWRKQLTGDPTVDFPPLPHVRYQPRPRQQLQESLDFIRRAKSEVSLSSLLRAAWALLVAQYTGSNDVIFAVTLSGRNVPVAGVTEMLAPTITTVPIRIHIDPSTGVLAFLHDVQRQATNMIPFEHTGLKAIRELIPDLAAALDIRHLFVVHPAAGSNWMVDFPGLTPRLDTTEEFDSYALTVECNLGPGSRISVEARFDDVVVPIAQVQRMLDSFIHIALQLEQAESAPEANIRITDMETLSPSDLKRILATNSSPLPIVNRCVHELVLDMASKQPDAIAVSSWDGNLTYAELEHLSARLSHYLVGLGIGSEFSVGLSMDKSKWAAVSMLAILRAGGVVVPLGVQLPLGRVKFIARDACIAFLLADKQQAARLANLPLDLILVDESLMDRLVFPAMPVRATVEPHNAAWIVYTSGSTGTPKGVVLVHSGICTSMHSQIKAFNLDANSRVLQFAAHTFDAAIQEIFTTLCAGGCVCVPSEEERMSDLQQFIIAKDINFVSVTPTVAELLDPSQLPNVNTLVLLGEPVKPSVLVLWMDHASVLSGYGPTECSIYAIVSARPMKDRKEAELLGAPLPSCRMWVVDPEDYHRLCPIGAPGELLIEGPHVSRGYLNDAPKTEGAFVVDPSFVARYSLGEGHRMYRTGDLVRENDDGTYTNLGRRDTQVKIRGQRVEIGEIEYCVVQSSTDIRSAAAVVVRSGEDRALIAVAVELAGERRNGDTSLRAPSVALMEIFQQIRVKLTEVLPQYMIPDLFIPMAPLPVNSSGKLDRRAIEDIFKGMMDDEALELYRPTSTVKVEVSTETERQIQQLWSQLLRRPAAAIGAKDNFFHLGGDSLIAVQLVAAAKAVGLMLSVVGVFQNPVLRDLCRHLDQDVKPQNMTSDHSVEEAVDEPTRTIIGRMLQSHDVQAIFNTTDFQALVLREHMEGRWLMHATITYKRKVNEKVVWRAFQNAVERNEILRTVFVPHGGHTYQAVLHGFVAPFQECHTSTNLSEYCQLLVKEDQVRPLRLCEPPLKAWFIQGEHKDSLVIRLSHAQYDGISLPIFFKQLQSLDNGHNIQVDSPRQMSYYLSALRLIDQTPAIDFWRRLLAKSTITALPTRPSQQNQTLRGLYITLTRPSPKCNRSGLTFSSYLKAAWAMVLARASGSCDVVFGHLISGRSLPLEDIEKVHGPCVNLIPVRVNTKQQEDAILQQVHEQYISALPYEYLGWETILRECTSWPLAQDQYPRFNSILQYQNLPESEQTFWMHGSECNVSYDVVPPNITDVWITVEPRGNEIHLTAGYSEQIIDSSVVEHLMEDLCETLKSMENRLT